MALCSSNHSQNTVCLFIFTIYLEANIFLISSLKLFLCLHNTRIKFEETFLRSTTKKCFSSAYICPECLISHVKFLYISGCFLQVWVIVCMDNPGDADEVLTFDLPILKKMGSQVYTKCKSIRPVSCWIDDLNKLVTAK